MTLPRAVHGYRPPYAVRSVQAATFAVNIALQQEWLATRVILMVKTVLQYNDLLHFEPEARVHHAALCYPLVTTQLGITNRGCRESRKIARRQVRSESDDRPMSSLPPLTLGPLMLPPGLWLSLLTLAVATMVWRRQLARVLPQPANDDTPLALAGVGMLGARVGFVVLYWREYLDSPWAILNIRDGGWWWPAGIAAIALGALLLGWRRPPLRRPLLLATTAAALVGTLAAVAAVALSSDTRTRVPELRLHDLSGEPVAVHDGRPSVINLWATWCPPCRREMPALVAAAQRYPQVRFVLVNQGEDQATVADAAQHWPIAPELIVLDPESALGDALGVRGYPTTVVVAADGHVLQRHSGEVSTASLVALIEQIQIDAETARSP